MYVFGPVPSRRLGSSLGINHIPPKHCPYACIYCQAGRTTRLETRRRVFYPVEQILAEVERKIAETRQAGNTIDYLSLVPDGEPALDANLAGLIGALRKFGLPVAVITNGALIGQAEVQEALCLADWVSVKVDAVLEKPWRRINRPHGRLSLPAILDAVVKFRNKFRGEFVTETMLVDGVNDDDLALTALLDYLIELQAFRSWFSIPTRPPAEAWVKPPSIEVQSFLCMAAVRDLPSAGFLFEPEPAGFLSTGNLVEEVLSITAVHPMREESLRKMVVAAAGTWEMIESLCADGRLARITYMDEPFYVRTVGKREA